MARYRGRHRAPSTTGRNLARTAIAGAVIGAPLAAAPVASADTGAGTAWDKLAQCESTGNWSINTGNGFSGGLLLGDVHHPRGTRSVDVGQLHANDPTARALPTAPRPVGVIFVT